jgi:hypothetical protein
MKHLYLARASRLLHFFTHRHRVLRWGLSLLLLVVGTNFVLAQGQPLKPQRIADGDVIIDMTSVSPTSACAGSGSFTVNFTTYIDGENVYYAKLLIGNTNTAVATSSPVTIIRSVTNNTGTISFPCSVNGYGW